MLNYIYISPKFLEEVDMKKRKKKGGVHNVKLEKILKKLT